MSKTSEEYAYGHLKELSASLHSRKLAVISEYLQKPYDAVRRYVAVDRTPEKSRIAVPFKFGTLMIHCNSIIKDFKVLHESLHKTVQKARLVCIGEVRQVPKVTCKLYDASCLLL